MQVAVDVPRTAPGVAFFHTAPLQKALERLLYIWGIRCRHHCYVTDVHCMLLYLA